METSLGKIYLLLILGATLVIFSWFASQTTEFTHSILFISLGLISTVFIAIDIALKEIKKPTEPERIETWIYEKSWFTKLPYKPLIILGILIFSLLFTYRSLYTGIGFVTAPEFQLVDPGPLGHSISSGLAGVIEEAFFRGFLAVTFGYALFYYLFGKNVWAGILGFLIVGIGGFWIFHWARYGFHDISASYAVLGFGALTSAWVLLTKNIVFPITIHFFNNFFVRAAGQYDLVSLAFTFITTTWGKIIIAGIVIYVLYWIMKRRRK